MVGVSQRFMNQYPIWGVDGSQHMDRIETAKFPDPRVIADLGASFLGWKVTQGAGVHGFEDRTWRQIWQLVKEINAERVRLARLPFHFWDYCSGHYTGDPEIFGAQQARYARNAVKSDPGEIPLHLDVEPFAPWGYLNWLNISKPMKIARGFLREYDQLTGTLTPIYSNPGMLPFFGDFFKDRDLWLSWYNELRKWSDIEAQLKKAGWRGRCWAWQYASDGDLDEDGDADGIDLGMEEKNLDLNVSKLSVEEFSKFCGRTPSPLPSPVPGEGVSNEDQPSTPLPQAGEGGKTKVVELMKPLGKDGLNIRNKAGKPSTVTGWVPVGKEIEVIERVKVGSDTWGRVGQGQFCAIEYLGAKYLG